MLRFKAPQLILIGQQHLALLSQLQLSQVMLLDSLVKAVPKVLELSVLLLLEVVQPLVLLDDLHDL